MEELTDNDIHISPLTIIKNRYGEGGEFLAFNLESWDVPRDINEDGLDFWSFWHHEAKNTSSAKVIRHKKRWIT